MPYIYACVSSVFTYECLCMITNIKIIVYERT